MYITIVVPLCSITEIQIQNALYILIMLIYINLNRYKYLINVLHFMV